MATEDTNIQKIENMGNIELTDIVSEMENAYIDYSMSVIIDRALPDVRDGLKPVHRRILYAMHELGLRPEAKFRKSATIVGDVLGKYHPHGDTAVYDSLVRMAQDFSLRYTLVNGQGNFGSMDGDSAAAMRYTEAKMAKITREMLFDIDKNTVNFTPNYDGSRNEPTVLPSRVPNLLINGGTGIAVGMATNIPPHNLKEVVGATIALIENPEITIEELLKFVKGPDFPTGGELYNIDNIRQVYATGRGPLVTRAKAEIVERGKKGNAFDIIVSEMTYQTNKATLIEKMANMVRDKKLDGIKDIRDESDRDGVRIVIELKSDAYPQKVLNKLYKLTDLQKTYHVNMLALCDGIEPKTLSLKQSLQYYIRHRKEVVIRKTEFELQQAKDRAHILEGLKKALDFIDEVISNIRGSESKEIAKVNLIKRFEFSQLQAQAILDMRLQTLAGLERQKILDELAELVLLIQELESILASEERIFAIIKNDLQEVSDQYGDERKTRVFKEDLGDFKETDFIPNEDTIIILTKDGYIKRVDPKEYRSQRRGGVGISGVKTREDDAVSIFLHTTTHAKLLFFTNNGRVLKLKAYEIPQGSRIAKGQSIVNFLELSKQEQIQSILPTEDSPNSFISIVTKLGIIKKSAMSVYANVRKGGIIAINLKENDTLIQATVTCPDDDIILFTSQGKAIRFPQEELRPMGRTAAGVKAMTLKSDDTVLAMQTIRSGDEQGWLVIATSYGYGKKSKLSHYKVQKRGGSGVKVSKITTKTGPVIGAQVVTAESKELIAISLGGNIIKLNIQKDIPTLSRDTQGVKIMRLTKDDTIASIAVTTEDEVEGEEEK
jgi:DNA gyrase subunit A